MSSPKPIIATIFLFLSFLQVFAQKPPIKFGKVSMEEMKMTVYDKDTTAEAVVLADYGSSEINYTPNIGFELHYKKHMRIKILKKEGLSWANHNIRFYQTPVGGDEKIIGLKGVTYNLENGKFTKTKLENDDVYLEHETKFWKRKKFALPNVKVGSVIEFQYTIKTPYYFNFRPWYFQNSIPVVWSEYRTLIPEYYDFKQVFGGMLQPSIFEEKSSSKTIYLTNKYEDASQRAGKASKKATTEQVNYIGYSKRWVYENVPAIREEKYMTTPKDYMAKVEFELHSTHFPNRAIHTYTSTWIEVVDKLLIDDNFGNALNLKGIVKELTEQIPENKTPEEKVVTAYYLIKKHMKWNERYDMYAEETIRKAFKENSGNTAEINLLLVNLLRSVGIESYPVLISTRSHGKINTNYPRESAFNSAVALARVNGKNILLDASIGYLTPGELAYNSLNGKGLVAVAGNSYWTPLRGKEQVYTSNTIMATITDEKLTAQISRSSKSWSATILRNKIAKDGKEKFIENYKEKNSDWKIAEYEIENENNATKPLKENLKIEDFENIDVSDEILYLPALLAANIEENPFKSETRDYPVDFAMPIFKKHMVMITIPAGYEVSELPEVAKVTLPNNAGLFLYQAQKVGNNIQVLSQLKINKVVFAPQEYNLLKELYRLIIEKYGEQIVLKRIEE